MIVYSISELKKITSDFEGKKGAWYVGGNVHTGHLYLLNKLKKKVDKIIGIYYNNYYGNIEENFGQNGSITLPKVVSINPETIRIMEERCDVLLVLTGDYNPIPYETARLIEKQLPLSDLPEIFHKDLYYLKLLRGGQSILKVCDDNGIYDYQMGCIKDYGKWYQKKWSDKFLNLDYDLIEPVTDDYGNNISNSLNVEINKPLIVPGKDINWHNDYISDIPGLKFHKLFYDENINRIYARLQCGTAFANISYIVLSK